MSNIKNKTTKPKPVKTIDYEVTAMMGWKDNRDWKEDENWSNEESWNKGKEWSKDQSWKEKDRKEEVAKAKLERSKRRME